MPGEKMRRVYDVPLTALALFVRCCIWGPTALIALTLTALAWPFLVAAEWAANGILAGWRKLRGRG